MSSSNSSTRPINVLFVGGGRRVSLAHRFMLKGCRIFSYEDEVNCPISEVADIIKGLRWKDPGIKDHLNATCSEHNIDLVIPLQDEAIPLCCGLDSPCPASRKSAMVCFDKQLFEDRMYIYDEYPLAKSNDKVIVKPRFGFSSKGISIDFYNNVKDSDNIVVQRYIDGTEYSVDCYFNKKSELVGYVPRTRLFVQGGEVVRSITMNRSNPLYKKLGKFISEAFKTIGAVGPYCIQFIEKNGDIYIIEANARFGGGVILSLEAGFNIIGLILFEHIFGDSVPVEEPKWREDFAMTRYFSEHFYDTIEK